MGKKPDVTAEDQQVELSPEQIETARIAHCEILQKSIVELEQKEKDAQARLVGIQSEIDKAYLTREDNVKSIELIASNNYVAAKAKVNEANDLMQKTKDDRQAFEQERSDFLQAKEVADKQIAAEKEALAAKSNDNKSLSKHLGVRLANIKAREDALHGEE